MKPLLKVLCIILLLAAIPIAAPGVTETHATTASGPFGKYHTNDVYTVNTIIKNNLSNTTFETWKPGEYRPKNWDSLVQWIEDENGRYRVYSLRPNGATGDLILKNLPRLGWCRSSYGSPTSLHLENLPNLLRISISGASSKTGISDVTIQGCDNLQNIDLQYQSLKTLDVRGLKKLRIITVGNNQLTDLKIAGCTNLEHVYFENNELASFNYNLPKLRHLKCYGNNLTSLNLSGFPELEWVDCRSNKLVAINATGLQKLEMFDGRNNRLTGVLDLSACQKIEKLMLSDNQLTGLKLAPSKHITKTLVRLDIDNNRLTSLDVSGLSELTYLSCDNNDLQELNLKNTEWLYGLSCADNRIKNLEFSGWLLRRLDCSNNKIETLDLSRMPDVETLDCSDNNLTSIALNEDAKYWHVNVTRNLLASTASVTGRELVWDKPSFSKHYFEPQKTVITKPDEILIPLPGGGNTIPKPGDIPLPGGGSTTIPKPGDIPLPGGGSTTIPKPGEIPLPGGGSSIPITIPKLDKSDISDLLAAYLAAKYGSAEATLSFDTAGGSKIPSVSKERGTFLTLDDYVPTRSGYMFEGWYDNPSYAGDAVYVIKLDANKTIYAKWEPVVIPPTVEEEKGPFYAAASKWAVPELEKAFEANLIPPILFEVDMTKPISREEFAELAVSLYEATTGKAIVVTGSNPFDDTVNPTILKAYTVGITTGTAADKFSPNVLITREQCATMLYRTIKAMSPNADYGIAGVADFPDQALIADWAVEGTKYMSKLSIILGNTKGEFMPRDMASREAAVLMDVRTFELF